VLQTGNGMKSILISWAIGFFGLFVRGFTGFGSALVMMPLFLFVYNLQTSVVIVALLEIAATAYFSLRVWKEIKWSPIAFILPLSLPGVAAGSFFLVHANTGILKRIFGLFVILFTVRIVYQQIHGFPFSPKKWPRQYGFLAGIFSGMLGGLYGTGGPPVTIFLENQLDKKDNLIATQLIYFLILDLVRLIPYGLYNLIGTYELKQALIIFPSTILGMLLGTMVNLHASERVYRLAIAALLLLSGSLLLFGL